MVSNKKEIKKQYEMKTALVKNVQNDIIYKVYEGKESNFHDIRKYTHGENGIDYPTKGGIRLKHAEMIAVVMAYEEVSDPSLRIAVLEAYANNKDLKKPYEMPVILEKKISNEIIYKIYAGKESNFHDIRKYVDENGANLPTKIGVRLNDAAMLSVVTGFEETDDPTLRTSELYEKTANTLKEQMLELKEKKDKKKEDLKKDDTKKDDTKKEFLKKDEKKKEDVDAKAHQLSKKRAKQVDSSEVSSLDN